MVVALSAVALHAAKLAQKYIELYAQYHWVVEPVQKDSEVLVYQNH